MKVLVVLTYYRPHTSGLTIYAERLAEAMVQRGHQVTVLTSQFDQTLPREEFRNGVRIVRAPVWLRISKGVIMPTFGWLATKLVNEHDMIHLHLPQFDAAGVAFRGRMLRKPTVITYHCDLIMPPGILSRLANAAVLIMNEMAGWFTHRIVTYTQDYADHSKYLSRFKNKLRIIQPPVVLPETTEEKVSAFDTQNNPNHQSPVIGMAARFATEKGVEILINALKIVLQKYPRAMVQFAGPYKGIVGEEEYFARLEPQLREFEKSGNWKFLGTLDPETMVSFYRNIDVLVMSSLNSTEAFGLVQIEAMINGKPSIASNLPGVRQPVKLHGMGQVTPIGDSQALAKAIMEVIENPERYKGDPQAIRTRYLPESVAVEYEKLYQEMAAELRKA